MKKQIAILSFAFAASTFLVSCNSSKQKEVVESEPQSPIPYTVELVEYVNSALPNLHSFTHAVYEDKIIMLGGRRRGLHSINYNFSDYASNEIIYVIDTKGWDLNPANWQVSSQSYTSTVKADASSGFIYPEQFHANNMEFFTQNDILYMIGGYVNIKGNAIAVPAMTGVNLNSLVYAVMGHSFMPVGSVRQTTNTALAITGGEIGLMDNTVYLAFGWDGNNYTHQVSSLTFTDNVAAKSLAITLNPACATCADGVAPTNTATSSGYFRRRDGSMSAMISPKDSSNLFMYYAGVFKNGNTYFDNPISITANAAQEDSLHMRGNVYTCQVIPAWSRSAKMSYATFLGGMTNSKYGTIASPELLSNSNSTVLPVDTNNYLSVPFSNRFTTVVMDSNKNLAHYLLPDSFPATIAPLNFPTYSSQAGKDSSFILPAGSNPFNGAESEIIWRIPAAYNYNNSGVLDLDRFFANNPQGGQVGYLYGGILSVVTNVNMNNTTNFQSRVTVASNRIFGIKIVPTSTKNSSSKK